jgi:branched-chain amino acid transport system permease protein
MSPEVGQTIISTLVLGSLYAVVGLGFVLLYQATRVLNFAQGSLMLLGAAVFGSMVDNDVPWVLALLLTLSVLGLIGVLAYLLFFRRLIGAAPFTLVIATLGLSVVVTTIVMTVWGPGTRNLPPLLPRTALFSVGGVELSVLDVFCVLLALAVVTILEVVQRRTRLGIQMRAVADSAPLAGLMRISVTRMSAIAWAIACVCAGVAGITYAMRLAVDPVAINALGLLAFPAVLLGGLDSVRGAVVGGFLLALAQNTASYYFGGIWSDVTAYAVLLVVLMVRPHGLFGARPVVRL